LTTLLAVIVQLMTLKAFSTVFIAKGLFGDGLSRPSLSSFFLVLIPFDFLSLSALVELPTAVACRASQYE
jgi:hypothetical protein